MVLFKGVCCRQTSSEVPSYVGAFRVLCRLHVAVNMSAGSQKATVNQRLPAAFSYVTEGYQGHLLGQPTSLAQQGLSQQELYGHTFASMIAIAIS